MAPRKSTVSQSQARILLVDDNANGLCARKSVLEELGHHITTVTSGADALEKFGTEIFDVVVTDYKMPRMDGQELIRRLRKLIPELSIIMISGYADTLGLDEKSTGADAVIQKSAHEVSHLVRAVNRLLRRKMVAKAIPVKKGATSVTSIASPAVRAKHKTS